jgi:LuxR family transcriptional regulator, maltose regulon positive regulatory protein
VATQPSAAGSARLIRTKVLPPVARRLLPRADLIGRIIAAERKVTLLCAPAGSGKSSLLASWANAASEHRPFAWFALDKADDDPKQFWSYAVEALHAVHAGIGRASAEILRAPGPPQADLAIIELINEIAAADRAIVLALDDYHVIAEPEIHHGVTLLVEHLPAGVLQLAISTRSEPPLPLARWRGRGELTELDAPSLRFSAGEAEAFLNGLLGLGLDRAEVAALRDRTEGWPAGLYLAALSVQHRTDRRRFIAGFTGTNRYIVDYLGAEVLRDQDADVRSFLLQTALPERLCAPLCDAVTGTGTSARMLERIERSNLFLVPLDARREWYRYHHLFRDLLVHELQARQAAEIPELHRRAARWLLDAGFTADGIHHIIAAGDVQRACDLIAAHWPRFLGMGDDHAISGWLEALPEEALLADARVCVAGAMVALSLNRLSDIDLWVHRAERARQPGPAADGFGSVAPAVAFVRASQGLATGNLDAGRSAATQAVTLLPDGSPWRQLALCTLGITEDLTGRTDAGVATLEQARRIGRVPGLGLNLDLVLGALAVIQADQGLLAESRQLADEALAGIPESPGWEHWGYGLGYLARAKVLARLGHLSQADAEAAHALDLLRRGWPVFVAAGLPARAGICAALGNRAAALAQLAEARQIVAGCPSPGTLPQRIEKAARQLRSGQALGKGGRSAEPLTAREITVLRLLASKLSQREIGRELFVSLNTVKFHAKSIFRKLGVSTRAEAVARARELDLL